MQQNTPGLKRKSSHNRLHTFRVRRWIRGTFLTAYFGSARADMGSETILPMITAVVLGGTLITGEKEALSVLYWRVFSLDSCSMACK